MGLRRASVIAAALYLALVQVLTAAHAASGEAATPDHDASACVYHFAHDRSPLALPEGDIVVPETEPYGAVPLPVLFWTPVGARSDLPPPRAPPIL